jgi:hypothetical protein
MATTFRSISILICCIWNGQAQADARTPIGIGPHSRIWSGMGTTAVRGGEAVQYNPANLILSQPMEVQYELSALQINYGYTYPGTPTVEIDRTTVIPFLGGSGKLGGFAAGAFVLPIPEDSEAVELNGIRTRKISDEPIEVTAKQSGNGLGLKSGLGAAARLSPRLSVGLSMVYEKSGSRREVLTPDTAAKVQTTVTESSELLVRAGGRWSTPSLVMTASIVPYGTISTIGSEETLGISGLVPKEIDETSRYPFALNSGAALRLGSFWLLGDIAYHRWKATANEDEVDIFSTIDFMLGGRWMLSPSSAVIGSYAFFPGYKGDGLVASRTGNNQEIKGMEIGELDAMSRHSVSGGFEFLLFDNRSTAFVNYQFADREVFADGVAAGEHRLRIIYVGLAGQYGLSRASVRGKAKVK